MKKFIFSALMCLSVLGLSAQDYQHSIGGMVGSMYGASYKGFVFGVEHLALQADLGVRLESTAAGTTIKGAHVSGEWDMFTFELNPNVLYQNVIGVFDEGRVDWFAGGGLSIGLAHDLYSSTWIENTDLPTYGKFGFNAIAGAEIVFDAPVNLSLDFRPGYGLAFNDNYHASFFDWALVVSVRYRL